MPEVYLELSARDQKDILQTAAAELGKNASHGIQRRNVTIKNF